MDYRILGPLEVLDADGRRLDLGAPRQRAVLAVLLVHVNEVVSIDRLIDELWGAMTPNAATSSLQAYISNLRRVLEPGRSVRTPATVLVTEAPGYVLRTRADQVDAMRFERLAIDGRQLLDAGDASGAVRTLDAALGLWRGHALTEYAYDEFAASKIAHLHELRSTAEENRVEAKLTLGDHVGALADVGRLVAVHPHREQLRTLQILALYRAGRQADALRAFEETRRVLADEVGLEPGRDLQRLHRQVLDQDPALDAPARAPLPPVKVAAAEPASRPAGAPRRSTFVGRADALAGLLGAMQDAVAGHTRIVLIEGEPGIGKTRLVDELASRAREIGVATFWGRCHDDEAAPPLWPWVQILRGLHTADELPTHLRADLANLLPELGPAAAADLVPDAARFRLFDAVREAVDRCAHTHPCLIALDDLQWADVSTLRLLRFLAIELRDAPLMLVVTLRSSDGAHGVALRDALAELSRRPDTERLALTGLTVDAVAALVHMTTDISEGDARSIAAAVHQRTNGNPFFVTELARLMQSERRLDAGSATDVPAAVGDVIRRRIRRLPDSVQTVLGVAAVIGREFDLDVLAGVCGVDTEHTLDALEAALVTHIVQADDAAHYRFTHALVSETLYADITPVRRERLHGRVAAVLESRREATLESHYGELASHYAQAGSRPEKALTYARLAAEQATLRLAYDEAVAHWRAALAALDRTPDGTPAARARLLFELAAAEHRAGNLAAGTAVHDAALAAAERSGDAELLAEAALAYGEVGLWQVRRYGTVDEHIVTALSDALEQLGAGDSSLRARVLTGLAVALHYREGDRERSLELAREAAAMARRLGDTDLLATCLVELVVMLDAVPDPTEQRDVSAELGALRPLELSREAASAIPLRLVRVALAHGRADTLDRDIDEFASRAIATRHPDEQLWATWAQTTVTFLRGRLDDAERLAGKAFALHQRLGIWGAHDTYALHMMFIWREQGRLAEVAPVVEPLLAEFVHPSAAKLRALFALDRGGLDEIAALLGPDPVPRSRDFTWLTDVCLTAELAAAADLPCRMELYESLLPFADRVATMEATFMCLGPVSYYLGLVAASLRQPVAAHHFAHAADLSDTIGAVPWSRRARANLDSGRRP